MFFNDALSIVRMINPSKPPVHWFKGGTVKMGTDLKIDRVPERRQEPRSKCDFIARIRGHDENGKPFEEFGKAVNLSRHGVYILLNRKIPNGMKLSIRIAIPNGYLELGTSKLAVHGMVVRSEYHSEMVYGIAVKFHEFKFV
jgi:hypothetical protein